MRIFTVLQQHHFWAGLSDNIWSSRVLFIMPELEWSEIITDLEYTRSWIIMNYIYNAFRFWIYSPNSKMIDP